MLELQDRIRPGNSRGLWMVWEEGGLDKGERGEARARTVHSMESTRRIFCEGARGKGDDLVRIIFGCESFSLRFVVCGVGFREFCREVGGLMPFVGFLSSHAVLLFGRF